MSITKISTAKMSHEKWLEERSHDVGGSELGSILGQNRFQSAYSLWCQRTGRTPAFTGNMATEVGTALEPFVAKKFSEISGISVVNSNFIYRNSKYPALHATPDRVIHAKKSINSEIVGGLECKTTSAFNCKRFRDTDVPEQYIAQCAAYLMVLDVDVWYLAVLVGNSEFHIYRVIRDTNRSEQPEWCEATAVIDREDMDAMSDAAEAFMSCIREDKPPYVDCSESTEEALKTVYDTETAGKEIALPFREDDVIRYLQLQNEKKQIDKEMDFIKNAIMSEMQDAETAKVGDHKVTWKTATRTSIDTKQFKADCPELYTMYAKVSESRTFKIS